MTESLSENSEHCSTLFPKLRERKMEREKVCNRCGNTSTWKVEASRIGVQGQSW